MNPLNYQMNAQLQRWLYRENPSWVFRQIGRSFEYLTPRKMIMPISDSGLPCPTLVIGGLTVGGSGKTPIAAYIASLIHQTLGLSVALVCRGWGGQESAPRRILSSRPGVDGDEATMLLSMVPEGVTLWASRDLESARQKASADADVVVIDDGLCTSRLGRTHNLVVVDSTAPRNPIPAGPYRESLLNLDRADFVWLHKIDEPGARPLTGSREADLTSRYAAGSLILSDGTRRSVDWLQGREITVVCGIGRPESFIHRLESLGAKIVGGVVCADHRSASPRSLAEFVNGPPILTTRKDAARWVGDPSPMVLDVDVEIMSGEERLHSFLRGVCLK